MITLEVKQYHYLIATGINKVFYYRQTRLLFFITLLFYGCFSYGQGQGVVVVHTYFYGDTLKKEPFKISYKIWFKNQQSIQEVPILIFTENASGKKTSFHIKHYSYLDPDKNVCYNYKNFSDTAKAVIKYSNIDSVSKNGGWNFYSTERFEYDSALHLPDTTFGSTNYGRIRLNKKFIGNNIYLIVYYRMDKKGSLVKIFKNLSDTIGYPLVRDDNFIKNRLFMRRELEFISNNLSQRELNIFKAWEKNVKNNRIKN